MTTNYLSHDFLASKGIELTKPLKDWITRASYLAKNRGSPQEKRRYEMWALQMIETAMQSPGGIQSVQWNKQSPVMPPNTPECRPSLLDAVQSPLTTGSTSNKRAAILDETLKRAPAEVRPFVSKAFDLYDADVIKGRRSYQQVTFLEMMNIAKHLYNQDTKQRYASVVSSATASSAAVAHPTRAMDHHQPSVAPTSNTNIVKTRKRGREVSSFREETIRVLQGLSVGEDNGAEKSNVPVFVGQSMELERNYSRYEPSIEDIRPESVLTKAFKYIKKRALEKEQLEGRPASLKYLSDQLKGMRQDIRVQNIVSPFTITVYEYHARLCLDIGDVGEFNQCQASLKSFYSSGSVDGSACCISEFFCYRLTYLFLSQQYDSLSTELINYTNAQTFKGDEGTKHRESLSASDVRRTLALCCACHEGDCLAIPHLLMAFPKEMLFLVRIYLQRMRIGWLREILCGVRGSISLRFLMSNLGFLPYHVKGKKAFWLDGDEARSQAGFETLFSTLKIALPKNFTFGDELIRDYNRDHNGRGATTPNSVPSIDASVAKQSVESYVTYLGTRRDASI